MNLEDVEGVARLHCEILGPDIISELGFNFARIFYREIYKSNKAFGFVASEDHRLIGFIIGTQDVLKLYRETGRKKWFLFLPVLMKHLFKPSVIISVIQPILCPIKIKSSFNRTELLFCAVRKELRRRYIGKQIVEFLFEEFKKRDTVQVKAFAYNKDVAANKFYLSQGFKYVENVKHYGDYLNLYLKQL